MKNTKTDKKSKVFTVIGLIVSTILFLSAAGVTVSAYKAKKEGKTPVFFGYFFSIVVSGSMEPEIPVGSLLAVKAADIETVETGDNIVFTGLSGDIAGEKVVHEVIEKGYDEEGIYFITKGKSNALPDSDKVRESNFIGIEAWHSAAAGKIFGYVMRIETLLLLAVLFITVPVAVKQIKKLRAAIKDNEKSNA